MLYENTFPYALTHLPPDLLHIIMQDRYKGTLMANRGFTNETANKIIRDNHADLVSFGIDFIANPDLIKRLAANLSLAKPDTTTFYTGDEKGYTDYATAN